MSIELPTQNLADDFLCGELHIAYRVQEQMPELKIVSTEADVDVTKLDKEDWCPKASPSALVLTIPSLIQQFEEQRGQLAFYLSYRVMLAVEDKAKSCNMFLSRRNAGPLISRLLGVNRYRGLHDQIDGVLPGWSPTPEHGGLSLFDSGSYYGQKTHFGYFWFDFYSLVSIRGAPDASENC